MVDVRIFEDYGFVPRMVFELDELCGRFRLSFCVSFIFDKTERQFYLC